MNEQKSFFFYGMVRSLFLLSFILIPAQIFRVFFIMGLKGDTVIAAGIIGGLGMLGQLGLRKVKNTKKILYWIFTFLTGILAGIAGLLAVFGLDSQNWPTMAILTGLLVSAYYTAQLHLGLYPNLYITDSMKKDLAIALGWACPLFFVALIQWLIPAYMEMPIYMDTATSTIADGTLLFSLGLIYLLLPLFGELDKKWQETIGSLLKADSIPPKKEQIIVIKMIALIFGTIIILVLEDALFLYGVFIIASEGSPLAFFGITVGASIGIFLLNRIKQVSPIIWLSAVGISGVFALFANDPELIRNALFMFALGVTLGISAVTFFHEIEIMASFSQRAAHITFFFLLIMMGGAGFLAGQFRWLVRDLSEWLLPVTAIMLIVMELIIILSMIFGVRYFPTLVEHLTNRIKTEPILPVAGKMNLKTLGLTTLILMICCPLIIGALYASSRIFVTIRLPQTMYTVDGTPVTTIDLYARTAKILLYNNPKAASPLRAAPVGDEFIRPGKTIRIGAYFYGGTENITADWAANWIGHNVDVFSLGGWPGGFFDPDHILSIRAINPDARFYIMTFATTFWGNPDNPDCGNLADNRAWGCVFNETMLNWTVKNNDGTEAYGVRRGPGDPYTHLMDMGSEGWAKFFAWFFDQRAREFHANGVTADEVMWRGYWGTSYDQLRDYESDEDMKAACYQWLRIVDENMESEFMTQAFWPEAQQYQQAIWGELAFRCGGAYGGRADDRQQNVFYEYMNWMQIVENMYSMASANKSYIWAAWYNRDDPDALEYAIGTYLMGKPNNCTWLGFHPQPVYNGGYPANLAGYDISTVKEEIDNHPEFFDLEMGLALGNMTLQKGFGGQYWQRNYENGIVLVNPYHAQIPGFQNNDPVFAPSH
jgi:hypothetical protein